MGDNCYDTVLPPPHPINLYALHLPHFQISSYPCVCVVVVIVVVIVVVVADDDGKVCSARLAKASRAFGCLRSAIFQNKQLSIAIKHEAHRVVVLPTLLYGAETWAVKGSLCSGIAYIVIWSRDVGRES